MDGIPSCGKKILVILKGTGFLLVACVAGARFLLVFFNIHIELTWAEMPQTVCLQIGVCSLSPAVTRWSLLSRVAGKWFDSITLHQIIPG